MKSIILRLVFSFFVIPVVCFLCIRQLDQQGFFSLNETSVMIENSEAGPQYLNVQVTKLNDLMEQFKGQSLWSLQMANITHLIGQQPWIRSVHVSRSWPNALTIRVQPQEIRFVMNSKSENKLSPVTTQGELLEAVEVKQAPDVALLDGEAFEKKENRAKAVKVFDEIPNTGSFSRKSISSVRYDSKEGFWLTLVQSGVKVKIGEDQIALKSLRVGQVVDYLEKHEEKAQLIDANLSKKVHVKLR